MTSPFLRWRGDRGPVAVGLDDVRRRLEMGIVATYGSPLRISAVATAAEGDVALPPQIGVRHGIDDAIARYRALALAQAARRARGTHVVAPPDPMVHDLYLMAEGVAAERDLVERAPRLAPTLAALRFAELSSRPKLFRLVHAEREVEMRLRAMLASPADQPPATIPVCDSPAASLAWAEETAAEIRRSSGNAADYRPINPMTMWGLAWSTRAVATSGESLGGGGGSKPDASSAAEADEDSATRRGKNDASDGREQTTGKDAASEGEDAAGAVSSGGASTSAGQSSVARDDGATLDDEHGDQRRRGAERAPTGGIPYPEWDEYGQRVRPHGTTVSCSVAEAGDGSWADDVLREHAPIVREIRERFAPLRAQRTRLRRQRSGDELDLEAVVTALVDRRMGLVPSEQLYQVVRPARHTVAFALLVDASGSTATRLADGRTVLDVERMTLLLASEALASLGDPYAMLAFSGTGRHGVQVRTIKAFDEHDPATAHRRIAALAPQDNTRLGAAVRHATAVLRAQPAQRRVLLMLSDGQPNDVDWYQGAYAIEDSRRALHEARSEGVVPFCLTVEQDEREYLPHLFGRTGYRVLSRPQQLPEALLTVVKGMLVGA